MSRLKILSDLERDYEGFNRAVKYVMRDAENHALKGIHGPVSKLIRTEDEYAVAVEIALGAGLQNIVVDREEDGKSAINHAALYIGNYEFIHASSSAGKVIISTLKKDFYRRTFWWGYRVLE